MKYKKGKITQSIITGDDVIVTKGKHSLTSIDDAIDEQQQEIDKLKSNVKYLYSYGGVGGNGSGGGSGSGSGSAGDPILYITLNDVSVNDGNTSPIVLNGPGNYRLYINLRNSGGEKYFVRVSTDGIPLERNQYTLSAESPTGYKIDTTVNLKKNSQIKVLLLNSDMDEISNIITRDYIVNPHTFGVDFKYIRNDGSEGSFDKKEYFIGDVNKNDPFIDVSYKISIDITGDVKVKYSIGDAKLKPDVEDMGKESQGGGYEIVSSERENNIKIKLNSFMLGDTPLLDDANTGVYKVKVSLEYNTLGNTVISEESFDITLIPNRLYINVRNAYDLMYDSLDDIKADILAGVEGVPSKNINTGSYITFLPTVYEREIENNRKTYSVLLDSYDHIDGSDDSDDWVKSPVTGNVDVIEQKESDIGISVAFPTSGIKKLVFYTKTPPKDDNEVVQPTIKYIFVKEFSSDIKWYDGIEMVDMYFKSYQNPAYFNFPELSSGIEPLVIGTNDEKTTINFTLPQLTDYNTVVLSLGIQYNSVNADHSVILETYYGNNSNPSITLYDDQLYGKNPNENKILIPRVDVFDSTKNENYHLVQICRHRIATEGENSGTHDVYADYLYIDGKLESSDRSTKDTKLSIDKIVLSNVNAAYNLINLQYIKSGDVDGKGDHICFDGYIYQYSLAYKEYFKDGATVPERNVLELVKNIKFNGSDVIMGDESVVNTISEVVDIPIMMIAPKIDDDKVETFKKAFFKGYSAADTTSFGEHNLDLYWSKGLSPLKQVVIPVVDGLTAYWSFILQGTSTLRNKIKNISLIANTPQGEEKGQYVLFSPNFKPDDPTTFLPERIYTLKADIADSAHANNTCVGKFVNRVCTKFDTGNSLDETVSKYIKNTLEGFPFLMFFKIGGEVYYLGVYNFNMGRDSYYNLGYNTKDDIEAVYRKASSSTSDPFIFTTGECMVNKDLVVGEIQENTVEFDFHQYDPSVLFTPDNVTDSRVRMFGSNIVAANLSQGKTTLRNFVEGVAKGGAYCFKKIGKEFKSIEDESGILVNRYNEKNQVPDITRQFEYVTDGRKWTDTNFTVDEIANDDDYLLKLICDVDKVGLRNEPLLDYNSAAEYYTICMAFGLVDSVLKNMNIKSFNGKKCYIAFYDMDCANGEDNAGGETVSYLAATDWMHSDVVNGYIQPMTNNIWYDYWNESVTGLKGFDFTSSYLFAVIKYAYSLLDNDHKSSFTHYPEQFWAELRRPAGSMGDTDEGGPLQNVDYFMDHFFDSGVHKIPAYLTSLNYQVKYLYYGEVVNDTTTVTQYLANASAFNGTREYKVMDWLNRRFHFMDVYMNVMGLNMPIYTGISKASANVATLSRLNSNNDVVILKDAFSSNESMAAISSIDTTVDMYAPMNTALVIINGKNSELYLLNQGVGEKNSIMVKSSSTISFRCLGSTELTDISMVDPFFTSYYTINSNNLESIKYGGNNLASNAGRELNILSTSVKDIKLDIPNWYGNLNIETSGGNGQSVTSLNIANSGFYGEFTNLPRLIYFNISSISAAGKDIKVTGCPLLTGDGCVISGSSEKKTTLQELSMQSISGDFNFTNTAIEKISLEANGNSNSSFSIDGDESLKELSLTGFNKISIKNCPNISSLIINDLDREYGHCESLIIELDTSYESGDNIDDIETYEKAVLKKFPSTAESIGLFDFSNFTHLNTLGLSGCYGIKTIRIPDRSVNITTLSNNINLEYIVTEGENSKIVLTKDSTFMGSPRYAMRQNNDYSNYTKMSVSDECASLANTFDKVHSNISSKDDFNHIDIFSAKRFIENIVSETAKKNIKSLYRCFRYQNYILYDTNFGKVECQGSSISPNLSNYTSLNNISEMYFGTSIDFITKNLLSLNPDNNNSDNSISMSNIIGNSNVINMSIDAFENISYRLSSLKDYTFTLYKYDESELDYILAGNSKDNAVDIKDVLCVKYDESDDAIPLKITSINNINFNSSQYINISDIFSACPNVTSVKNSFNGDLSRINVGESLFGNITGIKEIVDSFNHNGSLMDPINLYTFFNWNGNTTIEKLFESSTKNSIGFNIPKTISYSDFNTLLNIISTGYKDITKLSNLFNNCVITDYDGSEISLSSKMDNVISIDALFYNCSAKNSSGESVPLNINRNFFSKLTNVTSMSNAFGNVHFSRMFESDLFCRYSDTPVQTEVIVDDAGNRKTAKLYQYGYSSPKISNMYRCFAGSIFEGVGTSYIKNWYELTESDRNRYKKDEVKDSDGKSYDTYYDTNGDVHVLPEEPYQISDCKDNYTHYVETITVSKPNTVPYKWMNHPIKSDQNWYKCDTSIIPSVSNKIEEGIYESYCCLPPDLLYACSPSCAISELFSGSNIIGVIPNHFLSVCNNTNMRDIFRNVNILPNVMYYYNNSLSEGSILKDTVIYRDNEGYFKKRTATSEDYPKAQFLYVPENFTPYTISIENAFNFRYNLPENCITGLSMENGLPDDPNVKERMPFHIQYFFTTTKSVKWANLETIRTPFIQDSMDISFKDKVVRKYSRESIEGDDIDTSTNVWTDDSNDTGKIPPVKDIDRWTTMTNGRFNVFLNLCGHKDETTGMLIDKGCPIQLKNGIKISNFLSGILVTFLNGYVFNEDDNLGYAFDFGDVGKSNMSSSEYIIDYPGLAKNIILPRWIKTTGVGKPISYSQNYTMFYSFMFGANSLSQYKSKYDGSANELTNLIKSKSVYRFNDKN